MPHALDMPPVKVDAIESPSPFTPLGTKGMGEGGGAGSMQTVGAAIQDALPCGRQTDRRQLAQPAQPRVGDAARPGRLRALVSVERR